MKKTLITLLAVATLFVIVTGVAVAEDTDAKMKALEKRIQKLEITNAKDRIQWTGDLRVEAHQTTGEVDNYIDGMNMQALTYGAMFMIDSGGMPTDPNSIRQFI